MEHISPQQEPILLENELAEASAVRSMAPPKNSISFIVLLFGIVGEFSIFNVILNVDESKYTFECGHCDALAPARGRALDFTNSLT